MKCPCCKEYQPGVQLSRHLETGDYCNRPCPHCRGTGEIQEGDWWRCDCKPKYSYEYHEILYRVVGGWTNTEDDLDPYPLYFDGDMEIVPLYRMEKVQ